MPDRLDALRTAMSVGWGELCAELGIQRSMLHYLRNGARNPSPALERRIREVEQKAGVRPPVVHAKVLHENRTSPSHAKVLHEGSAPSAPVPLAGKQRGFAFQQLEVRAPREAWNAEDGGPLADQLLRVLEDLDALKRRVEQIAAVAIRQQMQEAEKGKKP